MSLADDDLHLGVAFAPPERDEGRAIGAGRTSSALRPATHASQRGGIGGPVSTGRVDSSPSETDERH